MRTPSIALARALACALPLLLSACGGGGSSAPGGADKPAAAPLKLTAVTPADGAMAGVDAVPSASFDAAPALTTLTPASFSLSSAIGAVDARVAVNGNSATLTPARPLVWGSHYQLSVTDAVAGAAGGKLAAPSKTGFDTRMPTWDATAVIDADAPSVAFVGGGNALPTGSAVNGDTISLWLVRPTSGASQVVARHYSAATQRWSASFDIQGNSAPADSPELSVDAAGNACAIWEELQESGNFVVRAARYEAAGGRWSAPVTISNANGPSSRYGLPRVALGQNGNVVVAWIQYQGNNTNQSTIDTAYYDAAAKQWTPARPLQAPQRNTLFPQVAIDVRGNAMVLWSQAATTPDLFVAHAARYDAAAKAWGSATMVAANATEISYAMLLGFDPAGNAVGVLKKDPGTGGELSTVRYNAADNSWGKPVPLGSGDGGSGQLAFDPAGNATLVWSEFNTALVNTTIEGRRYQPSTGTWTRLPSVTRYVVSSMPLVADPAGNLVTSWVSYTGATYQMYAMRYSATSGKWDAPALIAESVNAMRDPALTIDQSGQALLQWPQHVGGFNDTVAHIHYSRLTGR